MAEGYLKSFNSRLMVCSAGTKPADRVQKQSIKVMSEDGIDISQNVPKLVDKYLKDDASNKSETIEAIAFPKSVLDELYKQCGDCKTSNTYWIRRSL